MTKNHESEINKLIAEALKRERSDCKVFVQEKCLKGSDDEPDIVVYSPSVPISVETEFAPARNVEIEARGRLGKEIEESSLPIERAFALRLPESLKEEDNVEDKIQKITFEFCLFAIVRTEVRRGPREGWAETNVPGLAEMILNEMVAALEFFQYGR